MKKREGNFKLILDLHGKRCDSIKSVNINLGFFSIAMERYYDQRNLYKEELGAFLQFLRVSPSPSWQSTWQWPGRHGAGAEGSVYLQAQGRVGCGALTGNGMGCLNLKIYPQ